MPNPLTPAQRLTMLMVNCGIPGRCAVCKAPIQTMRHLNGEPIPYDFWGENEGSPHNCTKAES